MAQKYKHTDRVANSKVWWRTTDTLWVMSDQNNLPTKCGFLVWLSFTLQTSQDMLSLSGHTGHMGGCWCGLRNLSKPKKLSGSCRIHLVHRKVRGLTSHQVDLCGSTHVATWLHVTFTERDHLLRSRAHRAMATRRIPQIGQLPQHTTVHRLRPIFFELHPSENSGTIEWNKRPLLFI